MDYDNNTMAAIYRCIILAAAGDGKVSDDELDFASEATHGTEQFYEFTNTMKGAFANVMADMFGLADDDVEEEERFLSNCSRDALVAVEKPLVGTVCVESRVRSAWSSRRCARGARRRL